MRSQSTRRDMLRLGAAALTSGLGGLRIAQAQAVPLAGNRRQPRLVVILLRGAMDG